MQIFQCKIEPEGTDGCPAPCEFSAVGELTSALEWVQLAASRDGDAAKGRQPSLVIEHNCDSVSITINKSLALEAAVGRRGGAFS